MNYHIVFSSKEQHCKSTVKYIVLAIVQGTMSAILVNALVLLVGARFELLAKIVVDTLLFVLSFYIQREFVFQKISNRASDTTVIGANNPCLLVLSYDLQGETLVAQSDVVSSLLLRKVELYFLYWEEFLD